VAALRHLVSGGLPRVVATGGGQQEQADEAEGAEWTAGRHGGLNLTYQINFCKNGAVVPTVTCVSARTIWLTGLPSAGKTTIARALAVRLANAGRCVEVLDGDVVREVLTAGLGFSRADRDENVRRIGYVADLLSRNGIDAVCSVVSPFQAARDDVRARHGERFVEVWVDAPVEVCAERDVKGLYARHARGELRGLTGVDDPYEPPSAPEVVLPTDQLAVDDCVELVWQSAYREVHQ
jgi:adenylylsulfate kinase